MIKQRYCLKNGRYVRCHDDEPMNQPQCPDRQQKLIKDKLNKLELVLEPGLKKKKCVCKFLKVLGLIILVLSAIAVFIALGVVGNKHHGRHHRGHHDHHRGRHGSEQESEDDFQSFQQDNDDIQDVTEQSAADPISKGTMDGDQVFDMFDEMYRQKMADEPELEGYHLFYINCTTSNKNKTDYSWDQHCQLKDWKHPDWNREEQPQSGSGSSTESDQVEKPDQDFLESAEEKPVEGRRLEETNTEVNNEESEVEEANAEVNSDESEEDLLEGIDEEDKQALLEDVSCRRGHCRKNKIAYIIDNHCFILSRPQKHHRGRHHGHPRFCPFIALVRTIHLLVMIWIVVFVVACCKRRCHRKKMRSLFKKLTKIENRDGNNCHMMMHRGFNEIEFHVKVDQSLTQPRFNFPNQQPLIQMPLQPTPQPQQQPQQQPNYYRVDLRNERIQDDSMVSRNEQYRV